MVSVASWGRAEWPVRSLHTVTWNVEHAAVSEPPQTDSTAGRARTVTTARALRHSIRDDINLVVVSASLLRMAGFTRDAEALRRKLIKALAATARDTAQELD